MQAIIDSINNGFIKNVKPVVVISNNSKSKVRKRAKKENIPFYHLSSITHPSTNDFDKAMIDILLDYKIDLIILAGYMKKIGSLILNMFGSRILNIHPSLLPKFGGKGMHGDHVHKAVLKAKETITGVTIHIVNNKYDRGPIIAQKKVNVFDTDTVRSLANRVLKCEHKLYSNTIAQLIYNLKEKEKINVRL